MKTRMNVFCLSMFVLLTGLGCLTMPKAADGPVFIEASLPEGKAVVYFFRPKRFPLSGATLFMSIPTEANNCYAMLNNGYYAHIADPGQLKVFGAIMGKQKEFSLDLKPNDKRFIKINFGTWGNPEYEEVPVDSALSMIVNTRLITKCDQK